MIQETDVRVTVDELLRAAAELNAEAEVVVSEARRDTRCDRTSAEARLFASIRGITSPAMQAEIIGQLTKDGFNALMLAVQSDTGSIAPFLAVIKELTSEDVRANIIGQCSKDGFNALMIAAQHRPEAVAPLLAAIKELPQDKQIEIIGKCWDKGDNALLIAARYQKSAVIPLLTAIRELLPVDKQAEIIGQRNNDGYNSLIFAAQCNPELIEPLLKAVNECTSMDKKAEIIGQFNKDGFNALMKAAGLAPQSVPLLLAAIMTITSLDKQAEIIGQSSNCGWNALMLATRYKPKMVAILVAAIKRLPVPKQVEIVTQTTNDQSNSLIQAFRYHPEAIGPLLVLIKGFPIANQAQILQQRTTEGWNALMVAERYRSESTVLLVSLRAMCEEIARATSTEFGRRHPVGISDRKATVFYDKIAEHFNFIKQENVIFIVVAHMVHTLPYFLKAVTKIGRVVTIIPKGPQYVPEVVASLDEIYKPFIHSRDINKEILAKQPDKVRIFLKDLFEQYPSPCRLVILDHGGYFAPHLDILQEFSHRLAGIVEHTWNGENKYTNGLKRLSFSTPIFSIARSRLKTLEDPHVARSIVSTMITNTFGGGGVSQDFFSLFIGVIGYGHMGEAVVKYLHQVGVRDELIMVCDVDSERRASARMLVREDQVVCEQSSLLAKCDVIIAAASAPILGRAEFEKIKEGACVICVTSSDDQFKEDAKEGLTKVLETPYVTTYQRTKDGARIYLACDGKSVNFCIGSTPHPVLHAVLASVCVLAASVASYTTSPQSLSTIIRLSEEQSRDIEEIYETTYKQPSTLSASPGGYETKSVDANADAVLNGSSAHDVESLEHFVFPADLAASYGRTVHKIQGDGNCQFRAIADQLPLLGVTKADGGGNYSHEELRRLAAEHININRSSYASHIEGEGVDSYIARISLDGTWGDELTMRALSRFFEINIVVIPSDGSKIIINRARTDNPHPIVLGHEIKDGVGWHYQSLRNSPDIPAEEGHNLLLLLQEQAFDEFIPGTNPPSSLPRSEDTLRFYFRRLGMGISSSGSSAAAAAEVDASYSSSQAEKPRRSCS